MWKADDFWNKSKVYISRAHSLLPIDEDQSALWSILALEMLGRSVLARIHPVLVADNKREGSLLFAFDLGTEKRPTQINSSEVFSRLQTVVELFTEQERNQCLEWMNMRNQELHTGLPAFSGYSTSKWLAAFYRISKILIDNQGKTLRDWLGKEKADAADAMIVALKENVQRDVQKAMKDAKTFFAKLSDDEIEQAQNRAESNARRSPSSPSRKLNPCPVCGKRGLLEGEVIEVGEAVLAGEDVVSDIVVLPTRFNCAVCRINLSGYAQLQAAGLGGQYSVATFHDPAEFFGIDKPAYEPEPEYMDE